MNKSDLGQVEIYRSNVIHHQFFNESTYVFYLLTEEYLSFSNDSKYRCFFIVQVSTFARYIHDVDI